MEQTAENLIGGRYRPVLGQQLPGAAVGLTAYAAHDIMDPSSLLMAVAVQPELPARAGVLDGSIATMPSLLYPLAHGVAPLPDGKAGRFVICPAPPGPAIGVTRRWSENELLIFVLAPCARVLAMLAEQGKTHRCIHPDNLFRAEHGGPVVLGEAWSAPAGTFQPAVFEPPYSAMCRPEARGMGSPADDVYALGATMLALAIGHLPMAGLDEDTAIRRKLEHGSFSALLGDTRISANLAELLRSMLADNPAQRPKASQLIKAVEGRVQRLVTTPARRAAQPMEICGLYSRDTRTLAHALAVHPGPAANLLRKGEVSLWLRRNLGDSQTAGIIDEILRAAGDDGSLVARCVAALDPLAPLMWHGIGVWPDGVGPAIARARAGTGADPTLLAGLITQEAIAGWALQRAEFCDFAALQQHARTLRSMLQSTGGLDRLAYALNPLLPAEGAPLGGACVTSLDELLLALEAASKRSDLLRLEPLTPEMLPFLAMQLPGSIAAEVSEIVAAGNDPANAGRARIRLLARVEARCNVGLLPGLTAWLERSAFAALGTLRSKSRRERMTVQIKTMLAGGRINPIAAVLEATEEQQADRRGALAADALHAAIERELAGMEAGSAKRAHAARMLGLDVASSCGIVMLGLAIILTVVL